MSPTRKLIPQHIVLVDDRKSEREGVPELLAIGRVWNTIYALSGLTELKQYLDDPWAPTPDIILIDMTLTDGCGETCIKLVNDHPTTSNTVIIAITAHLDPEKTEIAKNAGADGILEKPITADVLLTALKGINGFGWLIVRKDPKDPY